MLGIFLADSLILPFFLRNRFISSLFSILLINAVYHLLVNKNKGEGMGGGGGGVFDFNARKRGGGLIDFPALKRGRGLIREGGLHRGFTVFVQTSP